MTDAPEEKVMGDTSPTTEIVILGQKDDEKLRDCLPGIFDGVVQPELATEFLSDPRHHLAVALDEGRVIGMASAVHYVHPDKEPELWINEVSVAEPYRRSGLATRLLRALFDEGVRLGCHEAWVLSERANTAATSLYTSLGGVEAPSGTVMYSFDLDGEERADEGAR